MEKVTLNNKEQKRLLVLNEVLAGRVSDQEAAEMWDLSLHPEITLTSTSLKNWPGIMTLF
jgi:hypothetical protein